MRRNVVWVLVSLCAVATMVLTSCAVPPAQQQKAEEDLSLVIAIPTFKEEKFNPVLAGGKIGVAINIPFLEQLWVYDETGKIVGQVASDGRWRLTDCHAQCIFARGSSSTTAKT